MDYGNMLEDALNYTKTGIFSNVNRWTRLIVAIICLGIPMNGYVLRIYRGAVPAPEVDQWGILFIDGLKLIIIGLIYTIPFFIVWLIVYSSMLTGIITGNISSAMIESWTPNMGLIIVMYLIEFIIALILPVASIRFARMGSFSEAFNFSAIIETIGKIGWINYLIALILVTIVIAIPLCVIIFGLILIGGISMVMLGGSTSALLGGILAAILIILILAPLFAVFQARYLTRVYDSAGIAA